MTQLNLFVHYQKPADVVLFPFCRRSALARSIAVELAGMDFDIGKKHWQMVCRELRKGLRRDGLSTDAIRTEITGLADAVHEELRILPLHKPFKCSAVIVPLSRLRTRAFQHSDGAGEASALGQGAKLLAGLGGAHANPEYDAARACEGGAA